MYNINNIDKNTKVYFINLKDNKERLQNIKYYISLFQFNNSERINAFDTRKLGIIEKKYKDLIDINSFQKLINSNKTKKRNYHEELTNGAVGCFLSNLYIFKKMIDDNIPVALVMEDDINFQTDTYDKFWQVMNEINN